MPYIFLAIAKRQAYKHLYVINVVLFITYQICFLLGGVLGSCVAAFVVQNKFLPAVQVIATMQPEKRDSLAQNVRSIMASIDVSDITLFAALIAGDVTLRNKVVLALADYFRTEMSMAIVDH